MSMTKRFAVASTLLAVGLLHAPTASAAGTVCESHQGQTSRCPMDTNGGVQLVHQLSQEPCTQNQTWGVDRGTGVWVSGGCRAEFASGEAATARRAGGPATTVVAPAELQAACVEQAARSKGVNPNDVMPGRTRASGGLYELDLRTPAGAVVCTGDGSGNVRAVRSQ